MLFSPEAARAQQTVNLSLGYFTVRGQDARVAGDVLNANRNFLTFDIDDFDGGSIGGEWLVPVGRYIEAGAGLAFTRRTVSSFYTRLVNRDGRTSIRICACEWCRRPSRSVCCRSDRTAVSNRMSVAGSTSSRGVTASRGVRRYRDRTIFNNSYVAVGNPDGSSALGGIRFAGDTAASGIEFRYQGA
jgi:hypothetical protein